MVAGSRPGSAIGGGHHGLESTCKKPARITKIENPQEREGFRVEARCVGSKVEVTQEEITEERQVRGGIREF